MLPWKTISICVLTALIVFGTNLADLGPTVVAVHASSSQPKLRNCIDHPIVSGNLTLNICTSNVHYKTGDTVNILFLLSNTGPASLQMSTILGGVFVLDPNGKLVMRLETIECLGNFGNCLLSSNTARTISVPWNTSDPFSAATVLGTYKIDVGFSACPVNGPCLDAGVSELRVIITPSNVDNNPR